MAGKRTANDDAPLGAYRRKRDFERTAEPAGGSTAGSETGRLYLVQKHAASRLHYDLRLELDGVLKSWAVPKGPSLDPAQKPLAVLVEDHPIEYGDFEGIIPKGEYGGGTVMLWDRGEWEPLGDPHEGLRKGDLKFRLHGEKLRGEFVLARMGGTGNEDGRNWLLIKKADDAARPIGDFNPLAELPFSVASGRGMEEIADAPEAVWRDGAARPLADAPRAGRARRNADPDLDPAALDGARPVALPAKLKPQLATLTARVPDGDRWAHEVKLDGYRLLCRIEGGEPRFHTRNGHDWTDRFASLATSIGHLPVDDAWLDGEVVVLDAEGISDFGALQRSFRGSSPGRAYTYYLFDVPFAGGHDLRKVPLLERKRFLERVIASAPAAGPTVRYSEHMVGHGPKVFEQAAAFGLEGIICKQVDAPYVSKRAPSWLKVKCTDVQSFVVGGFTTPEGTRTGFGALLLGGYRDGELEYCGRVGTGFDDRQLAALGKRLRAMRTDAAPFRNPEADPDARTASWVRPELVARVEFSAWTHDGLLRHATFRGLDEDVDPGSVRLERPGGSDAPAAASQATVVATPRSPDDATVGGVRISNPGRTVYPEAQVTKRQVAAYYEAVADWILPHVVKRPLSLVRCPLGLAGESFFQRHVGRGFPDAIRGVTQEQRVEGEPYLVVDDLEGVISLVQMGVLEIHTWGCREDNLERPDTLVFDLDPGEGIEWSHVVASAQFVRRFLDDVGLRSFVKTTGGKGLHVVAPIVRRTSWDDAKAFTGDVARAIVRLAPKNFVATMAKNVRRHRIFVDYLRNTRGATAVAPYSTRARPGAHVSAPLAWEELSDDAPPSAYTVKTMPRRLASLDEDPWAGFDATRQSITKAMWAAVRG